MGITVKMNQGKGSRSIGISVGPLGIQERNKEATEQLRMSEGIFVFWWDDEDADALKIE